MQWDYRFELVTYTDHDRESAAARLQELGDDSWEAVGFSPADAASRGLHVQTTHFVVLLKRPRES